MPSLKLSDEKLEELVGDVLVNRMYRKEALKKYGISKGTFGSYIKKAVKLGFISKEQRSNWIEECYARGFEAKTKIHGLENAINSCKDNWKIGVGKTQDDLINYGKLGGEITQALHPHVIQNLSNSNPYQPKKCYYNEIKFSSFGERFLALLLLQYGLFDKIVPGENFQKKIDSKIVDFYINEDLIIEYHPIPKDHSKIKHKNEKEYKINRKKELENYFDGKIIVVTSISDFFKKLPKLGIKEDWQNHIEKVREVKWMLFDYDHDPDNEVDSNPE